MIIEGKYSLLDNETGEILEYKPKKKREVHIFAVYFPQLNNTVLDNLIYYMSSTNIVQVDRPAKIIESLKISKREYFRQINELIKKNICIRLTHNVYFINPAKYLKSSRSAFAKINAFYIKAKSEIQQKEIAKLKEKVKFEKKGNKIIQQVNDLLNDQ